MICRSICLASLLLLVAVSSLDAKYAIQPTYNDLNCTKATGAFVYANSELLTDQDCAENSGKCQDLEGGVGSLTVTCLDSSPLDSIPSDHVVAVLYINNQTDCYYGGKNWDAAASGPPNVCINTASQAGYFKAGCAANQTATGTFFGTADDCANNMNGTTYSYPANKCIPEANGILTFKFICPVSAPVAAPITTPVSTPASTPANKKASSATSSATFGLTSLATAWIITFV